MADSQLLAPWEYKGEVPQVVEAGELLWNRCPVRFELLQVENHVGVYRMVISPEGDDGSWKVLLSDSKVRGHELIQKGIIEAAKKKRIRREFHVDSEEVRIQPNGTGYWYQSDHTMSHFLLGRSVAGLTSSQTHELILGLMAKPSSDVAHALRFKRMDLREKRCRTFGFTSEERFSHTERELRALCRLVFYSDPQIWIGQTNLLWSLSVSGRRASTRFRSGKGPDNHCGSPRFALWARALERFGPMCPYLKRLCVREYFKFDPTLVWGELAAPSSHEQLEARLELRRWAQQHLPPDVRAEIERLGH